MARTRALRSSAAAVPKRDSQFSEFTDSGQTYAKGPCLQIAPPCHGDDDATTALQPTAMMQVLAGGFGAPEWGVRALGPLRHSLDIIIIAARGAGTTSRGRRGATPAEPATTVWCGA